MSVVITEITRLAGNFKVIKTAEDPDNWWLLNESVVKYIESGKSGIEAKIKAEITYESSGDKMKVSKIVVKEGAPKSSGSQSKVSSSGGGGRNTSIERQCAIKSAVELVKGDNELDLNNADATGDVVVKLAGKFAEFIAKQE